MLAEDEITIHVAREAIFLRPTLRAAMRLERAYGGFDKIVQGILDENVTVIASVIRESEEQRSDIPRLIESLAGMPLHRAVEELKVPLIRHVLQLAKGGTGDEDQAATSKPMSHGVYYKRLYQLATGWLGWTPETAWLATPSEITEALAGRTELLKAIFGNSDKTSEPAVEQSAQAHNATIDFVLARASARFATQEKAPQ